MRTLDLQRIRKEFKVTQLRLAELTGYPQGFLSRVENKKAPAPVELINKIANVLEISDIDEYIVPDEDEVRRAAVVEQKQKIEQDRIDRLLSIIEHRDRRIEKLEAEVDRLRKIIDNMKKT